MNDLYTHAKPRSSRAARQRLKARRRKYRLRRVVALLVLLLLVALLYLGVRALVGWIGALQSAEPAQTADQPQVALPFTAEYYLNGADLDGDGQAERVAIGKVDGGKRQVAVVTGGSKLVGTPITLPDAPVAMQDLPRAKQVLVWAGSLPKQGEPAEVVVGTGKAVLASGGEPDLKAWKLDKSQGLVPVDYYALIAPLTPPEPTVIVVDKGLNLLWYYEAGELVQTARVATGKHVTGPLPTAENQKQNYLTPEGHFSVSVAQPGVKYWAGDIPAGDPRNPLGTRWLGFNAFAGDTGHVWAIHGTNDPEGRLGRWVTQGTIEMRNEEIEALYDRVKVGTPILIQRTTIPEG